MDVKESGKKVYVGLSGGVDSSVSAYLLKKEGYDVTGVFIKVWQPDFVPCTWQEDRLYAMRVAAHLQIPFITLDLEAEYKKEVIDYMLKEYENGRTPNPDVLCNKEIKFKAFLNFALKEGADYIATGHYAQNIFNEETKLFELHRGRDPKKDQSYFLWALSQEVFGHVLFPVGNLLKTEVRDIARSAGLPTAEKKDSQGLCFISNVDMKEFLGHFLPQKRGDVLTEEGDAIGFHEGAHLFTIGERHGFTIEKKSENDEPYYVVSKDIAKNTITVSHIHKEIPPAEVLQISSTNFISGVQSQKEYTAASRYHGPESRIHIGDEKQGIYRVTLAEPLAATPGQSLVIFEKEVCLGGGIIV